MFLRAVELLEGIHRDPELPEWLCLASELTAANAAIFDVANGFRGCIAGVHEVLRRQGLMEGIWCLDPNEGFGIGDLERIDDWDCLRSRKSHGERAEGRRPIGSDLISLPMPNERVYMVNAHALEVENEGAQFWLFGNESQ